MINKGVDKGFKKEVRGYWIDIVNGPFFSFGVDCEQVRRRLSRDMSVVSPSPTHPIDIWVPAMLLCSPYHQTNKFAKDLFLVHNKGTGCEQHRHVSPPCDGFV